MPDDMSAVAHDTEVEPAPQQAPDHSAATDDRLQALSAELAKWQSRVPKLAAALKQRTTQVSELEAQLATRDDQPVAAEQSGAGVRARDELIAELEAKQRDLKDRQRQAEAQLHSRASELEEVQQESQAWREKWQAMATELDTQAAEAQTAQQQYEAAQTEIAALQSTIEEREQALAAKGRDFEELDEQVRSLEARNDKLFETTELANTQIEALGENLVNLKARLGEREAALVELGEAHDALSRSAAEHKQASETLAEELAAAQSASEQQRSDHADRLSLAQSEVQSLKELVADQVRQLQQLDEEHHEQAQEAKATQRALTEELDAAVVTRRALQAEHEQQLLSQQEQLVAAHAHDLLAQEQSYEQMQSVATAESSQQLDSAHLEYAAQTSAQQSSHSTTIAHLQLAWETQVDDLTENRRELIRSRDQALAVQQDEFAQQRAAQQAASAATLDAVEHTLSHDAELRMAALQAEHAEAMAAVQTERVQASSEREQSQSELAQSRAELERTQTDIDQAQKSLADAQSELAAMQDELAQSQSQLEQVPALAERIAQLEQEHSEAQTALSQAGQANAEQASQREQLTTRIRELEQQCSYGDEHEQTAQKLRTQLESVESEKLQQGVAIAALEAQVVNLDEVRAERDSYISAVLGLEDELQALRRAHAQSAPDPATQNPAANAAAALEHAAEVRRLEELIRERTEEANELRWQLNLKDEAHSDADSAAQTIAAGGDKMLLVLNQQLQMAQQENERLAAKVRQLSDASQPADETAATPQPSSAKTDDLTRIRGIGDKLATQLAEMGITTFAQIADLEPSVLEHEQHPLYSHRSRIGRDEWISQAAALR